MKRQNLRTVSLIVVTFTYLLFGAAIFGYLESEYEIRQKETLELIELIVKRKYNISEDDFTVLTTTVIKSVPHKAGIQWKFSGAFYFATTVVTTIGYGHSTPATMAGRSFCMIYALIGIPLGLVMFQSIGERLNTFVGSALRWAKSCSKAKNPEVTQTNLVMVVSVLSTILMTSMAAVFAKYERWDYFDALYYCFITLTTIGFGDYVALQKESALQSKPEYVALSLIFILFGLSVVSSAVNLLVLKFLTLNTEDERRDEQLRFTANLNPIQLEGDVITSNALQFSNERCLLATGRRKRNNSSNNNLSLNQISSDSDNNNNRENWKLTTPSELHSSPTFQSTPTNSAAHRDVSRALLVSHRNWPKCHSKRGNNNKTCSLAASELQLSGFEADKMGQIGGQDRQTVCANFRYNHSQKLSNLTHWTGRRIHKDGSGQHLQREDLERDCLEEDEVSKDEGEEDGEEEEEEDDEEEEEEEEEEEDEDEENESIENENDEEEDDVEINEQLVRLNNKSQTIIQPVQWKCPLVKRVRCSKCQPFELEARSLWLPAAPSDYCDHCHQCGHSKRRHRRLRLAPRRPKERKLAPLAMICPCHWRAQAILSKSGKGGPELRAQLCAPSRAPLRSAAAGPLELASSAGSNSDSNSNSNLYSHSCSQAHLSHLEHSCDWKMKWKVKSESERALDSDTKARRLPSLGSERQRIRTEPAEVKAEAEVVELAQVRPARPVELVELVEQGSRAGRLGAEQRQRQRQRRTCDCCCNHLECLDFSRRLRLAEEQAEVEAEAGPAKQQARLVGGWLSSSCQLGHLEAKLARVALHKQAKRKLEALDASSVRQSHDSLAKLKNVNQNENENGKKPESHRKQASPFERTQESRSNGPNSNEPTISEQSDFDSRQEARRSSRDGALQQQREPFVWPSQADEWSTEIFSIESSFKGRRQSKPNSD